MGMGMGTEVLEDSGMGTEDLDREVLEDSGMGMGTEDLDREVLEASGVDMEDMEASDKAGLEGSDKAGLEDLDKAALDRGVVPQSEDNAPTPGISVLHSGVPAISSAEGKKRAASIGVSTTRFANPDDFKNISPLL